MKRNGEGSREGVDRMVDDTREREGAAGTVEDAEVGWRGEEGRRVDDAEDGRVILGGERRGRRERGRSDEIAQRVKGSCEWH